MLARIFSGSLIGVDALKVEVEVDISGGGLPSLATVGLPDAAVKESKDRVRSAVINSGFKFPARKITINLAPADIKKSGTQYDLPIALGIIIADKQLVATQVEKTLFVGELALDGRLRPVTGVISLAMMARDAGFEAIVVPNENAAEAALVSERLRVYGCGQLGDVAAFVQGTLRPEPVASQLGSGVVPGKKLTYEDDFADVIGQQTAKRALEIAVAGGHNVMLFGPPGAGKTMLARRLPSILPSATIEEALETTKVYSAAGITRELLVHRPFRSPHHTISDVGMIGGGRYPQPGEVSLSHNGVLFLDEAPEFNRSVLEVLRQPLEDGFVTITRSQTTLCFPATFLLIMAQNPCPCGYYGDNRHECSCSTAQIQNYNRRLSGPLLDRIDMVIKVPALPLQKMLTRTPEEPSSQIRARVESCRLIQTARFSEAPRLFCNARMRKQELRKHASLSPVLSAWLADVATKMRLSSRGFDRVCKVSRTIADLAGSEQIAKEHLSEALSYRETMPHGR